MTTAEIESRSSPPSYLALNPRTRTLWRVSTFLNSVVTFSLTAGIVAFLLRDQEVPWMWALALGSIPLIVLTPLFTWLLPPLRYRYFRYHVDDRELRIRRGILWRSEVLVPHSRIQYVEVRRGVLERRYSLASLVVLSLIHI